VFLTACLEPGTDGVGDYTRLLAEELRIVHGWDVLEIAMTDGKDVHVSECKVARFSASMPWQQRVGCTKQLIEHFQPDFLSFQFVPYGWNNKGIISDAIEGLTTVTEGLPLHINFHEIWLFAGGIKKRMLGFLQMLQIAKMIRVSNPKWITTNTPIYVKKLLSITKEARWLPIFSNIPLSSCIERKKNNREIKLALFGSIHPEWNGEDILQEIVHALPKNRVEWHQIGRLNQPSRERWNRFRQALVKYPSMQWVEHGAKTDTEISILLSECDVGVATSPPGLIGKSGSAYAMAEHGLPVWITRKDWPASQDEVTAMHSNFYLWPSRCPERILSVGAIRAESGVASTARRYVEMINGRN